MSDTILAPNCFACQATTPTVPPPLSWSPAVQEGTRVWTCPECARANILSIEGRLDPAWW